MVVIANDPNLNHACLYKKEFVDNVVSFSAMKRVHESASLEYNKKTPPSQNDNPQDGLVAHL
jgi:hypothetical protein